MRLTAKPTKAHGIQFRSKLEAQWADYLTSMGYRWEYEKRNFSVRVGDSYKTVGYLPDFYLHDLRMYAEVKPGKLDPVALEKALDVARQTGDNFLLFEGMPHSKVRMLYFSGDMQALHTFRGGLVIGSFSLGGSFDAEQSL